MVSLIELWSSEGLTLRKVRISIIVFALNLLLISFNPSVEGNSYCHSDDFRCQDGRCVRLTYRCDGDEDCDDNSDELNCNNFAVDNFLLVSVIKYEDNDPPSSPRIYQMNLMNGDTKPILSNPDIPTALTIDSRRRTLYYVERSLEAIYSISIDHVTNSSRVIFRDTTLEADIEGISVDSLNQRLYFVDGGKSPKVAEITLTAEDRTPRILYSSTSLKPKGVIIDEMNSEVYWTDWGSSPGIFVIGIEPGAQRRSLITHDIVTPNALAIDFKEEIMYWVDAHKETIERAQLDGSQRRQLYRDPDEDAHYYTMAISQQFLFIGDWAKGSVRRFDIRARRLSSMTPALVGKKTGISYFNSSYNNTGRCRPERANIQSLLSQTTSAFIKPTSRPTPLQSTVTVTETIMPTLTSTSTPLPTPTPTPKPSPTPTFHSKLYSKSTPSKYITDPDVHPTKSKPSQEKEEIKAEKQESSQGLHTETVVAIALSGFVIFVIIASLMAWCGVRRHKMRRIDVSVSRSGLETAVNRDNQWLTANDLLGARSNSYDELPEPGPDPYLGRTEKACCETNEEWYTPLDKGEYDNSKDYDYVRDTTEQNFVFDNESKTKDYDYVRKIKGKDYDYDDVA